MQTVKWVEEKRAKIDKVHGLLEFCRLLLVSLLEKNTFQTPAEVQELIFSPKDQPVHLYESSPHQHSPPPLCRHQEL